MNRRDVALQLACVASPLLLGPATARAQGAPKEGEDFVRVAQPIPVPEGRVEVVEFFGYWCPHCRDFEPRLDAWARRLDPAQVTFRRVPVAFQGWQQNYQRLYYGIEALGWVDTLHRKVFAAIHEDKKRFDKDGDVQAFAKANQVDGNALVDAMKSFAVTTRMRQAQQLAEAYRIDGVPTLGVQGRWMTSPSIAKGHDRALAVVDALIARSRKG